MFHALGYDPKFDSSLTNQCEFGFCFDDPAQEKSVKTLMEQIPHYVFASDDGINFGELFATTCNDSPADSQRYKEAIAALVDTKEIEVVSPDGSKRLKATTIRDTDLLIPSKQMTFSY